MNSPSASYFEQACLWRTHFETLSGQSKRIDATISAIPSEVKTILDVGCGNGFFVNRLIEVCPGRFDRILGLDQSEEALKHVRVESIQGSINALPFEDKSFDLVTCLEVIEHLSHADFQKGLEELQRVSRKNVLVTVPNAQDLLGELVMCPKCYCCFNRHLHVRSFDKATLHTLFSAFDLVESKEIGPMKILASYGPILNTARVFHRRLLPPPESICPQCGYQRSLDAGQNSGRRNIRKDARFTWTWLLRLARYMGRKSRKRRWLLALYERT